MIIETTKQIDFVWYFERDIEFNSSTNENNFKRNINENA